MQNSPGSFEERGRERGGKKKPKELAVKMEGEGTGEKEKEMGGNTEVTSAGLLTETSRMRREMTMEGCGRGEERRIKEAAGKDDPAEEERARRDGGEEGMKTEGDEEGR